MKVVIRLKPFEAEPLNYRCVYLSEQQNHLVVETGNKKEIFVFDHVASETASQRDVYRMIGEEAVERSLQVDLGAFRGTTVVCSPMDRQGQERHTQ